MPIGTYNTNHITGENERPQQKRERGQSLVEVAIFLPVILLLLAGLVEISNLLVTQSRVDTAARIGARFGANGGEDVGIRQAVLNSMTETLSLNPAVWDIWIIRGTVNPAGTGFISGTWEFNHIYGLNSTTDYTETVNSEAQIQLDILDNLRRNQDGSQTQLNAADLEVVGVYLLHDIETILGLDVFIRGFNTTRGFSVMRQTPVPLSVQTNGCDAFPIGVERGVRSVTDVDLDGTGTTDPSKFPRAIDFEYPTSGQPQLSDFLNHEGDRPLETAPEGSIYRVFMKDLADPPTSNQANARMVWFEWNGSNPATPDGALAASLTFPGDSTSGGNVGYEDPGDSTDREIHAGNPSTPDTDADPILISGSQGTAAAVKNQLELHVDRGRTLRVIVWDNDLTEVVPNTGRVYGFAIMRIVGYQLGIGYNQENRWVLFEFLRWDTSCGQQVPPLPGP